MREAIEASSVLQIDDENPDIVIVIGGDGTLMSAFHKYFDQIDHIGFVSIHTGQLGFYTWHELTIEEIIETLSQDKIPMTADPLVQATVTLENGEETVLTGLNEINFRKIIQAIKADVYLNKQLFERFNGDGLCVSTPTGSTAYNKSLGGAIVSPTLKAVQMSEMSSINNRVYRTISSSIVIGERESITVVPEPGLEDYYFIGTDGVEFKHSTHIKKLSIKFHLKLLILLTLENLPFGAEFIKHLLAQTISINRGSSY